MVLCALGVNRLRGPPSPRVFFLKIFWSVEFLVLLPPPGHVLTGGNNTPFKKRCFSISPAVFFRFDIINSYFLFRKLHLWRQTCKKSACGGLMIAENNYKVLKIKTIHQKQRHTYNTKITRRMLQKGGGKIIRFSIVSPEGVLLPPLLGYMF